MQITTTDFDEHINGQYIPVSYSYRMSFDKIYTPSTTFFTLDTSILDGVDVLAPLGNEPIQQWDKYSYLPYTDRVNWLEWSREIEFPYSVSSAMADIELENTDGYFTPNSLSPISSYILPKRPLRILAGFNDTNLPQFVGITEKMPTIDDDSRTATFHALDFLSEMYTMPITETISMQNARTDEVLAKIFTQFGLLPSEYTLDQGYNIIPFVFYDPDTNAGGIFRDLMQAEMGNLWIDDTGIIRFNNRYATPQTAVYQLTESNTLSIKTINQDNIINTVKINADIRELQPFGIVGSISNNTESPIIIEPNSTKVVNLSLSNPCTTITQPTLGLSSTTSWFTSIKTSDSTPITSNVTITGDSIKTNTYTMFFSNTNAFRVTIDAIEAWGTAAKKIDSIEYKEVSQPSIDKFGEKVLSITNNFIQSTDQCDALALPILASYSEYANQVEAEIMVNPALQLNDTISLNVNSYTGNYKIIKIVNKLRSAHFQQILTCVSTLTVNWFILDQSLLDGTDVLGI